MGDRLERRENRTHASSSIRELEETTIKEEGLEGGENLGRRLGETRTKRGTLCYNQLREGGGGNRASSLRGLRAGKKKKGLADRDFFE